MTMEPALFVCIICRRKWPTPLDACPYCEATRGVEDPIKGTGDWRHYCDKMLGHPIITPHLAPCILCGKRQDDPTLITRFETR